MGSQAPSMATHTMRNQQQLGDFLFSSDLAKLRLGKSGNKAKINMNRLREDQLSSSIFSLDNSSGYSSLSGTEGGGITNLNYVKNKNTAKKERRKDQVDNAKFQGKGKNSRSASKSPKSQTRKELKQKESNRNEEIKVVAMDLDEDSEEDRRKSLNLQAEIEKEQEYQNQMNMIYNNPNYFDQYSSDLLFRPECHNPQPDQLMLDPQMMLQNPPMYFLAEPQQHFETQLLYFQPVDSSSSSSSDLSDSVSSSCSETSEDESSRSSPDYHNYRYPSEDDENNVPIELDEELNNLVLSIIAD